MKINLERLNNHELARLIRAASTLLTARLDESVHIVRKPAPQSTIVISEPPEADKDFCLYIGGLLDHGQYIKAAERQRVAEIATKYPEWVGRQGLPGTSSTGPWKAAAAFRGQKKAREV